MCVAIRIVFLHTLLLGLLSSSLANALSIPLIRRVQLGVLCFTAFHEVKTARRRASEGLKVHISLASSITILAVLP